MPSEGPPPLPDRCGPWRLTVSFGTLSGVEGSRFAQAVAAIDAANASDPNTIEVAGRRRPKELAHAELVSGWVARLRPEASEPLLLAARAHHVRRWQSPRSSYPDGRSGYLRWRRDLGRRQADDVGRILADVGYPPETVERVQAIVRKQHLDDDPEVQTLEDAMCLVFLETQFDDLAARLDQDHMVEVLRKTMRKMSDAALAQVPSLPLSETGLALIEAAGRP